ncbi:MAG: DNA polymerase III subunit epsilon [Alphaproteobacteria bacterium]|nr:DNA polymerase III subunit epsilon [Alphaproteobacteria bacterium]
MREIVLDTETTGLDPSSGHRIVEIGCVELENHVPTGKTYQQYLNPERDMPIEAERVHGLSTAFLSEKPRFAEIVDALMSFIGNLPLVIHNASFDLGFVNMELGRIGRAPIAFTRALDTVGFARRKIPAGAPASLDALCRRFGIDNAGRELHGALLDARLLADVYLSLLGGRQAVLALVPDRGSQTAAAAEEARERSRTRTPRVHAPTPEEEAAHAAFIATIKNAIWKT